MKAVKNVFYNNDDIKNEYVYNETIKRAFEIAFAGHHSIVLYGDDILCEKVTRTMLNANDRRFRKVDLSYGEHIFAEQDILYITNASKRNNSCCFNDNVLKVICIPPCACGKFICTCNALSLQKHIYNLPEILINKADIHLPVRKVENKKRGVEFSIEKAIHKQEERYINEKYKRNTYLTRHCFGKYCKLNSNTQEFLKRATNRFGYTMTENEKVIKLARTIADLAQRDDIDIEDIAEAIGFIRFKNIIRGRLFNE